MRFCDLQINLARICNQNLVNKEQLRTSATFSTKPGKDAQFSSSEKITQPPWAQKHLGMSVNLATFGGENKEYKIKSQPIDRFCLISLLYNWTYELMVSPTLYNLGFHCIMIFGHFLFRHRHRPFVFVDITSKISRKNGKN